MIYDIITITVIGLFMAICITGAVLLLIDAEDRWERKKGKENEHTIRRRTNRTFKQIL